MKKDENEEVIDEEIEATEEETTEQAQDKKEQDGQESVEDVNFLKAKNEQSEKEIEELKDRLIRLQAEFANYKKRTTKEKQDIVTYASEGLITELLPVLDNFERALDTEVDENTKSIYQGVEMVYNQFAETLTNNGLEEIECLNDKFDHNCHHAVTQQESDEHEEDTVIQVLAKGYKYKDKVIRPSMVMTSK